MLTKLAESGSVPDRWIRFGIRHLLRRRLAQQASAGASDLASLLETMDRGPIAVVPRKANEQHYEVPAEFFAAVLGPRLKYSSCYWLSGVDTLAAAEERMLALTCDRAELIDGQRVLELGCGWGSLTLWMAERYPASEIVAVSNSASQREFIERRAGRLGLSNVRVITSDMNEFEPEGLFDRVVSVEMFEHMRNHGALFRRIATWLRPSGALFLHVFCHRRFAYFFETDGDADWMARHFFTGGMMPSLDLFSRLPLPFEIARSWPVDGKHYQRTAEAWLERLDARRDVVAASLRPVYGAATEAWIQRWRMFFMACAELFGYGDGEEWLVGHYLLHPQPEETT